MCMLFRFKCIRFEAIANRNFGRPRLHIHKNIYMLGLEMYLIVCFVFENLHFHKQTWTTLSIYNH